MATDRVAAAVDKALTELVDFDLIVRDDPTASVGASTYIKRHRHEYLRTVRDVLAHRPPEGGSVKVLEIGAFFGVVCLALADLGYEVVAADIPEYIEMPEQVARYARHGIKTQGVRLEQFRLPFDDEQFDVIVMCEVLEHLNFNPLPLLKEINRIGKPDSIFYLSLPNMASLHNRVSLLGGRGIGVTVGEFFDQLDPSQPTIANGHWREYTAPEIREMLERLGFTIARQYYFSLGETLATRSLRNVLGKWLYRTFPTLKENQTTVAVRSRRTETRFSIPSTVHPELREL